VVAGLLFIRSLSDGVASEMTASTAYFIEPIPDSILDSSMGLALMKNEWMVPVVLMEDHLSVPAYIIFIQMGFEIGTPFQGRIQI
jgi:hypothetical protein